MSKASKSKPNTNGRHVPVAEAVTEPVTPLCERCSALCCRQIALPLDNPEDAEDFDNIRWYLMHENVHVFVEDEQWYIA
ncbi:MAG: YkgJ family cysteine cluster protein, partial [Planctomycetota bacterium]